MLRALKKYILSSFLIMFVLGFSGCTIIENVEKKLGLKNDYFEYLNSSDIEQISIQSTRDTGFKFIVTETSAIRDIYNILSRAKKEIIIIDNYAGKKLFDIIKNINVKVKIYTENIDNISKEKYEKQYNNLEIINTNIFHDRFIIIDNKVLYHSGASFKDLGKKCFAITKMEGDSILKELLNKIS